MILITKTVDSDSDNDYDNNFIFTTIGIPKKTSIGGALLKMRQHIKYRPTQTM